MKYYTLFALALILLSLSQLGCSTYQPIVPDSVAPDGKTYKYIYWPAGPAFWEGLE